MAIDHPPDGDTPGAMGPTSLALLTVPFVFTQDPVLTTRDLINRAKDRGHSLSLDDLQKLHELGLLIPLFRVDDIAIEGMKINVKEVGGANARVWTINAAARGQLRDPAIEGYSDEYPYAIPAGHTDQSWWNGYVYSPWQLLDLRNIRHERELIRPGWQEVADPNSMHTRRSVVLALCALAPMFLASVLRQETRPHDVRSEDLWRFRHDAVVANLLATAGMDPANMQKHAEQLLWEADLRDPVGKLLPLLRHAGWRGWSKLKLEALDCMWMRIGAELLLRAHESLAADGVVEPLPDLDGNWQSPLHDRLAPDADHADTLERALGTFGLSPHPRVMLLVEGETERAHVRQLLAEFGLSKPEQVRVQLCKGSDVNVQLITRYGIAPRLGKKLAAAAWQLDRTPTALVVAMDPENLWQTLEKRETQRHNLQSVIREEVKAQGGDISQEDLDSLVDIRVWGDDTYELANFTDDELTPAITQLAITQGSSRVADATWEADLRSVLYEARNPPSGPHLDIKVPLARMGVKEAKVALANLLWPELLAKCEAEVSAGAIITPVLQLVIDVQGLVARLSSGSYVIQEP